MHIVQRNTFIFERDNNGSYIPIFINQVWENGKVVFESYDYDKCTSFIENSSKSKTIEFTSIC